MKRIADLFLLILFSLPALAQSYVAQNDSKFNTVEEVKVAAEQGEELAKKSLILLGEKW